MGRSKWVWGSIPPGGTSLPPASTTSASGAGRAFLTSAMVSPSMSRSACRVSVLETRLPPRIRVRDIKTVSYDERSTAAPVPGGPAHYRLVSHEPAPGVSRIGAWLYPHLRGSRRLLGRAALHNARAIRLDLLAA